MDDTWRWRSPFNRPEQQPVAPQGGTTERFGGDGDDVPVLVAVINGPVESEMARDALTEAGIPAMVKRNSVGTIYGLSIGSFGRAEVWTLPAFAEQAHDVLVGIGILNPEA